MLQRTRRMLYRFRMVLVLGLLVLGASASANGRHAVLMDIDGTQTGSRAAARRLARRLSTTPQLLTGYVSGKPAHAAEATLTQWGLIGAGAGYLHNEVKVSSGGIIVRDSHDRPFDGWAAEVARCGWDNDRLHALLKKTVGRAEGLARDLLVDGPVIQFKRQGDQHRLQITLHPELRVARGEAGARAFVDKHIIEPMLREATILHEVEPGHHEPMGKGELRLATVIYDSNSVPGQLNVDLHPVTPEGLPLDKLVAMQWVTQKLGLRRDRVLFAGDAYNDPFVQTARAGFKVVIVGNAPPELKAGVGGLENVYSAVKHHADGVLEGLEHFGMLD